MTISAFHNELCANLTVSTSMFVGEVGVYLGHGGREVET